MTPAERTLWRALGETFPDQHWRKRVPLGRYTADFCCHAAKLIVEVDGGQHASANAYDDARTHFLAREGYRVLRFWNNDVLENPEGVICAIAASLGLPVA